MTQMPSLIVGNGAEQFLRGDPRESTARERVSRATGHVFRDSVQAGPKPTSSTSTQVVTFMVESTVGPNDGDGPSTDARGAVGG